MKRIHILIATLVSTTLVSTAADPSEGQEKIKLGHGDQEPGLAMTEIFEGKPMTLIMGPGIPQKPADVKPSAAPKAAIDTADKPAVARKRPVDPALPIVDDAAIMDTIKREADKLGNAKGIATTSVLRQQLQARKSCKPFATPALPAGPAEQLYARTGKSVLVIAHVGKCDDCDDWHVNCGSGFVVSTTGIAATNYHVMNDQEGSFVVAINRDLEVFPITAVLAADEEADCALVQLGDGSRNDFTPLSLATSATIGAPVTVISHPDENFFVMTRGVAARYAYTAETNNLPWLCITAEYARGSSGAPVFNDRGQVVGMVSSTQSIYYSENGKRQNDLQMVMRYCVPSSAIQALSQPETE